MDTDTKAVMYDKHVRDIACSVIPRRLCEIRFECITAHQDDPRGGWEFPHRRYNENTTFSKMSLDSTLARTQYPVHTMPDHVTRWKQMSAQLVSMDAPIDERPLVTVVVECFGNQSS